MNNLLDLASSITELKVTKSIFLVREAEVKLRFPYLTVFLMTVKFTIKVAVVYILLNNLSWDHRLLAFVSKEMVFKGYLIISLSRYLYYFWGIFHSLVSHESYIVKYLKKRKRTAEADLKNIELHRKRVLRWGDQYIKDDSITNV